MIRNTSETRIEVRIGNNINYINTGDKILDHMMKTLFFYMNKNVYINAEYDLRHHLWEDLGITIGLEIKNNIKSIKRFGSSMMPMDDSLILLSLDISRPYINFSVNYNNSEGFELNLLYEFLWALSRTLSMTLHVIKLNGNDPHHITEDVFKNLGNALKIALENSDRIESTKGIL